MEAVADWSALVGKLPKPSIFTHRYADSNQWRIAGTIGAEILSGAIKPGERIPNDAEMTKMFGVSRVVLREVVKTLAAKGLVAPKVRVGTVVREPAYWNWFDPDVLAWRFAMGMDVMALTQISEVRRVVEPAAASLAAVNATRTDLVRLREAITRMAEAEDDVRRFARADLQFHLTVTAASHNPYFHAFAAMIEMALLNIFSMNAENKSSSRAGTTAKHAKIVDAIEARDPDRAAKEMLKAVDDGLNRAKQSDRLTKKRPVATAASKKA
jgi:DNA-binding FadR family transcriptional regulator